jgi:hypothetical protein
MAEKWNDPNFNRLSCVRNPNFGFSIFGFFCVQTAPVRIAAAAAIVLWFDLEEVFVVAATPY